MAPKGRGAKTKVKANCVGGKAKTNNSGAELSPAEVAARASAAMEVVAFDSDASVLPHGRFESLYDTAAILKATRKTNRKLFGYDAKFVDSAVGKTSGFSVLHYICNAVHSASRSAKSQNLTMFVLDCFFEEFDLKVDYFTGMAPPSSEVELDDMMCEALGPAFQSNPVGRGPEQFLVHMEPLDARMPIENPSALILMIQPSKTISAAMNSKMIFAILAHVGKFQIPLAAPLWWNEVQGYFDAFAVTAWYSSPGTSRDRFIAANRLALAPLLDDAKVTEYGKVAETGGKIPDDVIRGFLETKIGAVLFEAETYVIQYSDFQAKGVQALADLENLSFAPDDIAAFWTRSRFEHKRMVDLGHPPYGARQNSCNFLDVQVESVDLLALADEWASPFRARAVSICVNILSMPRMPWEEACYGTKDPIQGVPETMSVPIDNEWVQKSLQMRRQRLEWFNDGETYSLNQMMKIVSGQNLDSLISIDRFAQMEIKHLKVHSVLIVSDGIHDLMLKCFPDRVPIEPPTIKHTIDALERLKTHRFFTAAVGLQECADYTICVNMLQNRTMGKPPSAAQIERFSVFF